MASAGMIMTKGDDTKLVMLRKAPPNDLIRTILEQIRIILEKSTSPWPKTWTYFVTHNTKAFDR
jgi:hypothetical protein